MGQAAKVLFLEAERFTAGRVGLGRGRLAEQPAQVIEVFLVGGRFFALVTVPLPFELRGSHCRMIQPARRGMVNDSKHSVRRAFRPWCSTRSIRTVRRGTAA
jgi:hypothetical protein